MAKSALLIQMIDIIRRNPGVSVPELAASTGRSERTIYRWLSELAADLQTPTFCRDGGYHLTERAEPKPVDLTPEELLALKMSLRSAPFGKGSPVHSHAESAWMKLRSASSCDNIAAARNIAGSHDVSVTVPGATICTCIIDTLQEGVRSRHRLRVLYRSQKSGETRQYTIDPYGIAFRRHSWYLVAFSHEHGKVIQMKLVRFESAVATGVVFDPPLDFSLQDYFRLSWEAWAGGEPTKVRVKFSRRVAPMICESKRHSTQVLFPQPDGSVIFEVEVAGIEEIAAWIMGYGKHAEVLAPESLKDHILDHLTASAATYGLALQKNARNISGLT